MFMGSSVRNDGILGNSLYYINYYVGLTTAFQSIIDDNTNQSNRCLNIGVQEGSRTILICDFSDIAYNFAHSNQSNPTLFIHSAAASQSEYVSLTHDGTDAIFYTPIAYNFNFSNRDLKNIADLNVNDNIIFSSTSGTSYIYTGSTAGVFRVVEFDIPVTAGGAADNALEFRFKIDGTLQAGLLSETDGAGSARGAVWKIPYMSGDYGAAWANIAASLPAPTGLTNGSLVLAYNTNGGETRLYAYSSGTWKRVTMT